jgi:hypothetical protein
MGAIALAMSPSHATQQEAGPANAAPENPAAQSTAQKTEAQRTKMTVEQVRAVMAAAEARRLAGLQPDPGPDSKALAEKWGVEVIGIRRTSAGYMLDFRFRVLDADKALPLFDHRIKPYVVADKSDIKLPVIPAHQPRQEHQGRQDLLHGVRQPGQLCEVQREGQRSHRGLPRGKPDGQIDKGTRR